MAFDKDKDKQGETETVQVALRIRPLVTSELSRGCELCLETVPNEPQVQVKGLAFTYNYVFPPEISQETFYNTAIEGMVKRLFKGYNVTILAYGQTGSGKTYSMGTCYMQESKYYEAGVIPRAVADIFAFVENNSDNYEFKIAVSFMELYQEQLYDLLSGQTRDKSIIDIREDHKGIILPGLTEEKVHDVEETMSCLRRGSDGRATGATAMNVKSSRSHAIFTIHISQECKADRNKSTTSKFHLVDLAGSERSKKTKATGDRFKEGVKINQGLLALGNVISALGDGARGFVGYRDSKLTRLLQDSLGGNSMTLMIACVSPADYNLEETVSTLRYADRARRIQNKPIVNQDAKSAEIVRLNNVIQQLRLQIINGSALPEDDNKLREELEAEKSKYNALNTKYLEVVAKNKNLVNLLQKSIADHTIMAEKAILAENSKDTVERKLTELTEECDRTIEQFKSETHNKTEEDLLSSFQNIRSKILSVHSEQKHCSQIISELISEEPELKSNEGDDQNMPLNLDENDIDEKEEEHAMAQAAKNDQLKDMIQSIADKVTLAEKLSADNEDLVTYQNLMKENESKISALEKEKDELNQQLKAAQHKSKGDSSLDERRSKIHDLEQQISELRKKCQQQANLIKIKEKNDMKIVALNREIQQIKAAKVKLIRTMKSENDRFRSWKLQNEKHIVKLCNQDRKMQSQMVKMENKFTKQQNVLKRKMEEAVAVNKRLKEALERQKNPQRMKTLNSDKVDAVRQWVEEELELKGSIDAAKRSLKELMNDRAILSNQFENLKSVSPDDPNVATLQEEIELRNAQIADLQQKIIVNDTDNKTGPKWDNMQTMMEAKCALKYLFNIATSAKCKGFEDESDKKHLLAEHLELKAQFSDLMKKSDRFDKKLLGLSIKHRKELSEVENQHAEKVTMLIKQLNQSKDTKTTSSNSSLLERLDILLFELERVQNKKVELEGENSVLRHENDNLKKRRRPVNYCELSTDNVDADDTSESTDPSYINTPAYRRSRMKRAMFNVSDEHASKRSFDGSTKCSCKTTCSNKLCKCRKSSTGCSDNCRCDTSKCSNRHSNNISNSDSIEMLKEKEETRMNETFNVDAESENEKIVKRIKFENEENDVNFINSDRKKRSFFYHNN